MSTETKKPGAKKVAPKKAQEKPLPETKSEPKAQEETKVPETKKPDSSIRPVKQPKVITSDEVMIKWEALVDILTHYLDQQRRAGRAWRHINQVEIVVKQHMLRFKRNLPK